MQKIQVRKGNNRDINNYGNFVHQQEAQDKLTDKILNGNENNFFSGLLAIPTGGGKTFIAVEWLLKNWIDQGGMILWIAHRYELLNQALQTFKINTCKNLLPNKSSVQYQIISGQHESAEKIDVDNDVLIAGKDSLRKGTGMGHLFKKWIRPNDLKKEGLFLVIDEAHHAPAKTYRELIGALKDEIGDNLKVLGLTATPFRTDQVSLERIFPNNIIYATHLRTLISENILSKPVFEEKNTEWHAVSDLGLENDDFGKIKIFDLSEKLKERIAQETARNKQIVRHYIDNKEKYGQTLVFALNKDHAKKLSAMFIEEGIEAGIEADFVVSGRNNNNEEKIGRFREGEITVLVNVKILTEGTDLPKVQTVFLTRPTISKILMTQMIGRALRGREAGGTEIAYIVSFIDDWQDKIAWKTPESVFSDEYYAVDETKKDEVNNPKNREKWIASRISFEKMAEFARMLNRTIDTSALEQLAFLERIPVGFYDFSLLETREEDKESVERDCEVLVYDHFEKQYARFVDDLPNIFKQHRGTLNERKLYRLSDWVSQKYFTGVSGQLAFQDEDVEDILRYYSENQIKPRFVSFDERKEYDIDKIANEIYEKDLRVSEKTNFVNNLWEKEERAWKELFAHKKSCFLNEIDLALRKKTHGIEEATENKNYCVDTDSALRKRTDIIKLSYKADEDGDAETMYSLGRIYENGECGADKNYGEAKKWYAKAAKNEHVEAMYCLGKIYENGYGVKKSYVEAEKWYREAAENGHVEAMNRNLIVIDILGDCFNSLQGGMEGVPEGLWGELEGLWGEPEDLLYELEHILIYNGEWVKEMARNGNVEAMLCFWACQYYEDLELLSDWLWEAAKNGHAGAMYWVAKEIIKSEGRYDHAVSWLEKAAKKGLFRAIWDIGISAYEEYAESRDKRDYDEAVHWLTKGADQGDELSLCKLGSIFYMNGSFSKALYCFEKVVVECRNSSYAGLYIGLMYYNGYGVDKDLTEAKIWLEEALNGFSFIDFTRYFTTHSTLKKHQDRGGIMHLLGKICEEEGDDDEAKEWYHNAEQLQENLYCSYEPHYLGEFWK